MPEDECVYIWERMSQVKANWDKYPTNNLISNLQIPTECRSSHPERFKHKLPAIRHAAKAVGKFRNEFPEDATYIPVPPSKTTDDPDYDDRLVRVLREVSPSLDVRELVVLTDSVTAKQKGLNPHDRLRNYRINEDEECPQAGGIVIFDDVLTTGSHFAAIKLLLQDTFPFVPIYGLFLARAVRPNISDFLGIF